MRLLFSALAIGVASPAAALATEARVVALIGAGVGGFVVDSASAETESRLAPHAAAGVTFTDGGPWGLHTGVELHRRDGTWELEEGFVQTAKLLYVSVPLLVVHGWKSGGLDIDLGLGMRGSLLASPLAQPGGDGAEFFEDSDVEVAGHLGLSLPHQAFRPRFELRAERSIRSIQKQRVFTTERLHTNEIFGWSVGVLAGVEFAL